MAKDRAQGSSRRFDNGQLLTKGKCTTHRRHATGVEARAIGQVGAGAPETCYVGCAAQGELGAQSVDSSGKRAVMSAIRGPRFFLSKLV